MIIVLRVWILKDIHHNVNVKKANMKIKIRYAKVYFNLLIFLFVYLIF